MEATRFTVNGTQHAVQADPKTPLLDVLRDVLDLKGTRFGCGAGECGACHVLVDGRSQAACNLPLWALQGKAVTTVEGLDRRWPRPSSPSRRCSAAIAARGC